jgi:hypothetical protein
MVRIGGKGMSYIVKNCPAITNNLTCRQAIYENMFCDYRTDCVIKQVIEKCTNAINTTFSNECFELAKEVTNLFNIEEINK